MLLIRARADCATSALHFDVIRYTTGQTGGSDDVPDPEAGVKHWDSAHHGGFTSLWCDGHVRRLSFGQLRRSWFSIEEDPD